jgi:hypothetical protein
MVLPQNHPQYRLIFTRDGSAMDDFRQLPISSALSSSPITIVRRIDCFPSPTAYPTVESALPHGDVDPDVPRGTFPTELPLRLYLERQTSSVQ